MQQLNVNELFVVSGDFSSKTVLTLKKSIYCKLYLVALPWDRARSSFAT